MADRVNQSEKLLSSPVSPQLLDNEVEAVGLRGWACFVTANGYHCCGGCALWRGRQAVLASPAPTYIVAASPEDRGGHLGGIRGGGPCPPARTVRASTGRGCPGGRVPDRSRLAHNPPMPTLVGGGGPKASSRVERLNRPSHQQRTPIRRTKLRRAARSTARRTGPPGGARRHAAGGRPVLEWAGTTKPLSLLARWRGWSDDDLDVRGRGRRRVARG